MTETDEEAIKRLRPFLESLKNKGTVEIVQAIRKLDRKDRKVIARIIQKEVEEHKLLKGGRT